MGRVRITLKVLQETELVLSARSESDREVSCTPLRLLRAHHEGGVRRHLCRARAFQRLSLRPLGCLSLLVGYLLQMPCFTRLKRPPYIVSVIFPMFNIVNKL